MSRAIPGTRAINRREFTVESVLAILAGVTITITGCGGTSPTSPSTTTSSGGSTSTGPQDVNGAISDNHGHIATVKAATITSPQDVTLDIQGNATHSHRLSLTADQVRAIGAGQRVSKSSSTDVGHDHTVTFN